jgi:hypothetical protein
MLEHACLNRSARGLPIAESTDFRPPTTPFSLEIEPPILLSRNGKSRLDEERRQTTMQSVDMKSTRQLRIASYLSRARAAVPPPNRFAPISLQSPPTSRVNTRHFAPPESPRSCILRELLPAHGAEEASFAPRIGTPKSARKIRHSSHLALSNREKLVIFGGNLSSSRKTAGLVARNLAPSKKHERFAHRSVICTFPRQGRRARSFPTSVRCTESPSNFDSGREPVADRRQLTAIHA